MSLKKLTNAFINVKNARKIKNVIVSSFKNTSIIMRVTLWYTVFMIILIAVLIGISLEVAKNLARNSLHQEIVQAVTSVSNNPEKFQGFDNGIFFAVYDKDNNLLEGTFPADFATNLPISSNEVREYKHRGKDFLYYDVQIDNEDKWIRGIIPDYHSSKEISFFLILVLTISPLLVLFTVYGGYKIIKYAFIPVSRISATALEIKDQKDFSKRIPTQNEGDELNKLASTFNKMLDSLESSFLHEKQFNIDVSHELRTPVTVILSESEYGLKYADNIEEAKESFTSIMNQSKRMTTLINQIMELSKIEENEKLNFEKVDLSQTLQMRLKDYTYICDKENITLKINIENSIFIEANQLMIERLIDNLLSNAIKFTKDEIAVSLSITNNRVKFAVQDNGVGLDENAQKLIWDRFYQVDNSRNKQQNSGNGLGLSLVKKIVEMHSADIKVQSKIGEGASFIVSFQSL